MKWPFVAAAALGCLCASHASEAADTGDAVNVRASAEISRFVEQSEAWIEAQRRPKTRSEGDSPVAPRRRDPFFYPRPQISFIAHDWNESFTVGDTNRFAMDRVRLTRSTRMMFARASFDLDRFFPYAQAGFGIWRPDRSAVPLADTEYAAQLGVGTELRIARRAAVALGGDYTMFYRETREPQFIPSPKALGAFAVMRAEF